MNEWDSDTGGRVDQPNPYGYDEYEAEASLRPDTAPDTPVHLTFPVEVDVAGWCRHLGLGETLLQQRDALFDACATLSLHLARGILDYGLIPDQETFDDIAQHLGLTEQELLDGPPESEEDSWGIAAHSENATAEEVQSHAARIRAMRQRYPLSGRIDHPRPFGYEGDC